MIDEIIEEESRKAVLENERRVDGRTINDIRSLSSSVGILPRTHGSGLFQRGETQVLSIVTLGSPSEEQILDGMEETTHKRYMHHYNFPGFSVGEAKPMRSTGRREIGHGALAEKALMPVLPSKEEFPLHDPSGFGSLSIQRIVFNGRHLRIHLITDGCGRAH